MLLIKEITDDLYFLYDIEPWILGMDLYRFAFLLLLVATRKEVKFFIGDTVFAIVKWLLINNCIDRYFGYTGWTWNDFLVIVFALLELIYKKYKK